MKILALVIMATGCKLGQPGKAPNRPTLARADSIDNLIESGFFLVERSQEKTEALISFESKTSLYCSFKAVNLDELSNSQKTSWQMCSTPQPGRLFNEKVSNLDPTKSYAYFVKTSSNQNDLKSEDMPYVAIKETSNPCHLSGDQSSAALFRLDLAGQAAHVICLNKNTLASSFSKDSTFNGNCDSVNSDQFAIWSSSDQSVGFSKAFLRGASFGSSSIIDSSAAASPFRVHDSTPGPVRFVTASKGQIYAGNFFGFKTLSEAKITQASPSKQEIILESNLTDPNSSLLKNTDTAIDLTWKTTFAQNSGDQSKLLPALIKETMHTFINSHESSLILHCRTNASSANQKLSSDILKKVAGKKTSITLLYEQLYYDNSKDEVIQITDWKNGYLF